MTSRRQFLARAPIGAAGLVAACRQASGSRDSAFVEQTGSTAGTTQVAPSGQSTPQPLLTSIPAEAPILRWTPRHEDLVYTFGGAAPRKHIQPGTHIITWTEDCFDGAVKTAADLPSKVMPAGHDNPQTGPFYLEGAEPGDTVAIHIRKLEPARNYGVSSFGPGFGALVSTNETAMLGPDFPETTWRYDLDAARGIARSTSRDGRHAWEVPVAPFLGCLGVAPAGGEARTTIVPGNFGGNMDCPEVRTGNTVYLGVNVPGALLSFGDGHYAMGDGEIMGAAIEGAMNVEVYVELQKKMATPIPRIENANEIMFVGSGRPLEDAARVAFKAMVGWVQQAAKMSELDAYQFVSQNARAPIIQLVDPEYTVLVKIAKSRVPRATA
ncbi:MAG TPA: acetamidase/formamidase family protein [Gemmatimonadaceae bacterium]|jgi:acetamidase/formamidase|nr:acetamidase/formamidase family protein [Gemmatimonadaceae bacterium]